jgi:hypothetical protein
VLIGVLGQAAYLVGSLAAGIGGHAGAAPSWRVAALDVPFAILALLVTIAALSARRDRRRPDRGALAVAGVAGAVQACAVVYDAVAELAGLPEDPEAVVWLGGLFLALTAAVAAIAVRGGPSLALGPGASGVRGDDR